MADILFICNANRCRSPIAEGIFHKKCQEMHCGVTVSSMGIHARNNEKATTSAIQICAEHGIDITGHLSRPLLPEELKQSRFIFAMEPIQVDYIDLFFPQVSDRLFMLSSWPHRKAKKTLLNDPVGKSLEAHRKIFNRIDDYITTIMPLFIPGDNGITG